MVKADFKGLHIQLSNVDKDLTDENMYLTNTGADVLIDKHGNTLDKYLPTIDDNLTNPTSSSPLAIVASGEGTASAAAMTALMR